VKAPRKKARGWKGGGGFKEKKSENRPRERARKGGKFQHKDKSYPK